MITILQYAEKASEFAIFPGYDGSPEKVEFALSYLRLGILGEYGEICEKLKKLIRGNGCEEGLRAALKESRNDLLKEIGDVLWYVCVSAVYRSKLLKNDLTLRALDVPFENIGPHWYSGRVHQEVGVRYVLKTMRYFSAFSYELTRYVDEMRCDGDTPIDVFCLQGALSFLTGAVCIVSPLTTLKEVACTNICKLSSRRSRGVIHGEGDDR